MYVFGAAYSLYPRLLMYIKKSLGNQHYAGASHNLYFWQSTEVPCFGNAVAPSEPVALSANAALLFNLFDE